MRDFHFPGRSPVFAANGMAATSMPAATLAALDVLREGGNALDAAVAAAAVLAVIEPHATGIGGDCFCLYAQANGSVTALNGSGQAPAAASIDWYERQGISEIEEMSAHAVTVPGAIAAWQALLARHGTRGLDRLLRPAIGFAEDGFQVAPRVAHDWPGGLARLRAGGATPYLPGGGAPEAGATIRLPQLAATLRAVSDKGAAAFYQGAVAADMVATLRAHGGLHTEADFAAGEDGATFVDPIARDWRGMRIHQCPPNGQGLLVLMMLGILEQFPLPPGGPLSPLRLHRHTEAARLVYHDRDALLCDPEHHSMPMDQLLSDAYLAALARLIHDAVVLTDLPEPGEAAHPVHADTVYLCVVDRDGNACSFINSLFEGFGSGIYAPGAGVLLHNRGSGFRVSRGHPNCIAPGKRPMHTIIPGMATQRGRPLMPFGVMGGHFQPMGQTLLLSNLLEHGLDIQQALDLPRLFPRHGVVQAERGIPAGTLAALESRGHRVTPAEKPLGGGQAILIDHARGVLIGGSDPRKDGCALGF